MQKSDFWIRLAMRPISLRWLFVVLLIGSSVIVWADTRGSIVDPPAIDVFPDHDKIGSSDYPVERAITDGRRLFKAKFNLLDGAGRPEATGDSKPTPRKTPVAAFQRIAGPDANSCAGCHNEPQIGGSGEFVTNTFVGAHLSDPPTFRASADQTNERNTTTVFGSGVVELVAREMTEELHRQRNAAVAESRSSGKPVTAELSGGTTNFGTITAFPEGYVNYEKLDGIDFDLIIRPFGVKGVAASIREFTTFALNQHHGVQAVERFGWERTGLTDFDGDGHETEFTIGQVTALVLFQATLPIPNKIDHFRDMPEGFDAFLSIGCAACHTPKTPIQSNLFTEPGRFNRPGAMSTKDTATIVQVRLDVPAKNGQLFVQMYSDLKRHRMCDAEVRHFCNEGLRQDNVNEELFMTARLWNLATSAPYCHRGDCSTISEAILAHGGEARVAREKFIALATSKKKSLVKFLLALGMEQEIEVK